MELTIEKAMKLKEGETYYAARAYDDANNFNAQLIYRTQSLTEILEKAKEYYDLKEGKTYIEIGKYKRVEGYNFPVNKWSYPSMASMMEEEND